MRVKGGGRVERREFSELEKKYIRKGMERKRQADEAAEKERQAMSEARASREREEAGIGEEKPQAQAIRAPRTLLGGLKPVDLKLPTPERKEEGP